MKDYFLAGFEDAADQIRQLLHCSVKLSEIVINFIFIYVRRAFVITPII